MVVNASFLERSPAQYEDATAIAARIADHMNLVRFAVGTVEGVAR